MSSVDVRRLSPAGWLASARDRALALWAAFYAAMVFHCPDGWDID